MIYSLSLYADTFLTNNKVPFIKSSEAHKSSVEYTDTALLGVSPYKVNRDIVFKFPNYSHYGDMGCRFAFLDLNTWRIITDYVVNEPNGTCIALESLSAEDFVKTLLPKTVTVPENSSSNLDDYIKSILLLS